MKVSFTKIRVTLLVFLVILSCILVFPVNSRLTSSFSKSINSILASFTEKTNLKISYESLSPSILSSFYINDIKLYTEEDSVLDIKRTKIDYSILKLISGDIQNGVKNITIDGIEVNAAEVLDIYSRFNKSSESKPVDIYSLIKDFPGNIKLKNISIIFEKDQLYLNYILKDVSVSSSSSTDAINFKIDSRLSGTVVSKTAGSKKENLGLNAILNGNIQRNLENSRMTLKVSNISYGDFRANHINLLATYTNKVIGIQTIQVVNPVSLGVDFNLNTKDINAQLKMMNFRPLSVFSYNTARRNLKKFKDLVVDTDTIVKCNLQDKKINFVSDSSIGIPDEIFSKGARIDFSFFGDEKQFELNKFSVEGQNCKASADLKYVYNTMQLSGIFELPLLVLQNGNAVSTEIYFDPLDKGFMGFSPQIMIGDSNLTALQINFEPSEDSYDLSLEISDYSAADSSAENVEPGQFVLSGTYLKESNYLQSSFSINSIYLNSIASLASQVLNNSLGAALKENSSKLSSYMVSTDGYFATNFSSVSYNVPYILLANVKKDDEVLMLSLDGNGNSIQLNQLSFVSGSYSLNALGTLEKDASDFLFSLDITSGSIPYRVSGSYAQNTVSISGDYGLDSQVKFGKYNSLSGYAKFTQMPFNVMNFPFDLSLDSSFVYDSSNGPEVIVNRLEFEESNINAAVNPKVTIQGNITKYGSQLDSILYSDFYSTLQGKADVAVNTNENILDSINCNLNLLSPLADEGISLNLNLTNPDQKEIALQNILDSFYVDAFVSLNNLSLNRFSAVKSDNNRITSSLSVSGSLNNPFVNLNLENLSLLSAGEIFNAKGSLTLEDKILNLIDSSISYSEMNVSKINAEVNLKDYEGQISGDFNTIVLDGKTVHAPLSLVVNNCVKEKDKLLPQSAMFTLSCDNVSGTFIKKPFNFSASALYTPEQISVFTSENIGLYATYYPEDSSVKGSINLSELLKAEISGVASNKELNVDVKNIEMNAKQLFSYFYIDSYFTVDDGTISGTADLKGTLDDPLINCDLDLINPAIHLTPLSPSKIYCAKAHVKGVNSEITLEDNTYFVKNAERIQGSYTVYMNKWSLDHVEGYTRSINKKDTIAGYISNQLYTIKGNANFDVNVYFEDNIVDVKGSVFAEDVNFTSQISSLTGQTKAPEYVPKNPLMFVIDLDIVAGTHANASLDPILRCILTPNSHFKLRVDQTQDLYVIDGVLTLKSGDISYLNRNFYIKSGTVKFNPSKLSNPMISVTAETREKDDKNQNVKIVLTAENQYLMELNPKFSSIPAKSESEIRSLLGQIAVADSSSVTNFLFAASDYAIQSAVGRKIENTLRDFLNFDIFSIRTNLIQNTLNMSVSRNTSMENISIGNFFDNSTVYMGKYVGSSFYVDAMLQFSANDSVAKNLTSIGAITLQPEFGMEMEAPFGNIRWNVAPDINALLNNQYVPSSSLTLSWKFAF